MPPVSQSARRSHILTVQNSYLTKTVVASLPPSQWLLAANTLMIIVLVWNGFARRFIVLSYVPKLIDGMMPFALGAAQCFAAYFAEHGVRTGIGASPRCA